MKELKAKLSAMDRIRIEYRQSVCQRSNELLCLPSGEIGSSRACEELSVPNGVDPGIADSVFGCVQ